MTGLNHRLRAAGGSSWINADLPALDYDDSDGWNNYTVRQGIPLSVNASAFRLTMQGPSSGTLIVPNVYIGITTNDSDFTATPVEVKFNGSSGFTSVDGAQYVSDPTSLSFTSGQTLLISYYSDSSSSTNLRAVDVGSGVATVYYKSTNYASTVTIPSVSYYGSYIMSIAKLEYR